MRNLELLAQCLEYIEKHLKDTIRTEDVAKACYCSKSTLEKMFHYVYHISVHSYIVRRRMMAAARIFAGQPERTVLSVALEYGYSSHEAFTRAFKEVWNCSPRELRGKRFSELFPRFREPIQKGDPYLMQRRIVDITQLYDLFQERKDCYFVCCDIKSLEPINQLSHKAGDIAIIETMHRLEEAAGEEDIVFRIGGDEFCILTDSPEPAYAEAIAQRIRSHNGEAFSVEDRQIPLRLQVTWPRVSGERMKYDELFTELHKAIRVAIREGKS